MIRCRVLVLAVKSFMKAKVRLKAKTASSYDNFSKIARNERELETELVVDDLINKQKLNELIGSLFVSHSFSIRVEEIDLTGIRVRAKGLVLSGSEGKNINQTCTPEGIVYQLEPEETLTLIMPHIMDTSFGLTITLTEIIEDKM